MDNIFPGTTFLYAISVMFYFNTFDGSSFFDNYFIMVYNSNIFKRLNYFLFVTGREVIALAIIVSNVAT